ncbi:hypothetical protein, partial [Formosa maritima]|uniref:hypothetical protein n=1 Tax=Formosa maritima TaxID=2592046 RepID=UPI00131588AE
QDVVYSAIFKNVNKTAKSLNHYLNTSGDTLFLKSTFNLNKIEVIGAFGLKEYAVNDSLKNIIIPLNDLPLGDYTIAVVHTEGHDDTYVYRKTIIFKISRLLPIDLGMNDLASNYSNSEIQIPILDLSENKIIKELPEPLDLASNLEISGTTLISNSETLGSINVSENDIIKEKPLKLKVYNLTDIRYRNHNIQSRANYRRNNLRPNGKRYD